MISVSFEVPTAAEWIKVNVNQTGFYRVTYSEEMWTSIISVLHNNHTIFSPADRSNLIDDAFTLCRAGILNATIPLELSLYLLNERDFVPWATAIEHLQLWTKKMSETAGFKKYVTFVKTLLGPVTTYVGWNDTGSYSTRWERLKRLNFWEFISEKPQMQNFQFFRIFLCTIQGVSICKNFQQKTLKC